MIKTALQGTITPLLNVEEMLIGYSVAWLLLYLGLLFTCGMLVYAELRRDHVLVRRHFFSQLGWAVLLTALLPRIFPLIWPPIALSWIVLAFLLLLEVLMPQGRRLLHRGLLVNPSRRERAQQKKPVEQTSSPHGSPVHFQQRETDGDT